MTSKQTIAETGAIVWVDTEHAIVASAGTAGLTTAKRIDRGAQPESTFLARVIHEIGDRPTVTVVGPSGVRLALEREYVAISHRPERLVGVPMSATAAEAQILARMERLAA